MITSINAKKIYFWWIIRLKIAKFNKESPLMKKEQREYRKSHLRMENSYDLSSK